MKQEIDLPFCCDFDFLVWVHIKALGSGLIAGKFQGKQKKKKSRSIEEDDSFDIMNVLTIQLVAEEKVATKKNSKEISKDT
jgi:hypothetical protein